MVAALTPGALYASDGAAFGPSLAAVLPDDAEPILESLGDRALGAFTALNYSRFEA